MSGLTVDTSKAPGDALRLIADGLTDGRALSPLTIQAVQASAVLIATHPGYDMGRTADQRASSLRRWVGYAAAPTRRHDRLTVLVTLAASAALWAEHVDGAWSVPGTESPSSV